MARIGVQASTVRAAFAENGPYETMRRIAEVGYRTVEMSQVAMTASNVEEMRRAWADHGVEVVAQSAMLTSDEFPGDSLTNDYQKIVDNCRTLGTTHLRLGMPPLRAMTSRDRVVEFAHRIQEFAVRLAEDGIALHVHNHHVEFARFGDRTMLDLIADEAPGVGLELDVHWIQRGGMDPVTVLTRHAGRARLIHLKDYRISLVPESTVALVLSGDTAAFGAVFEGLVEYAEVGQGTLDFRAIVEQALVGGAEHLFVEQDLTYGRDPFESLAMSRAHLVRLGYEHLF